MPHISEAKAVFKGDMYRPMFAVVLVTEARGRSGRNVRGLANNTEDVEHTHTECPRSPGGNRITHHTVDEP